MTDHDFDLSVIIPTLNEEQSIPRLLQDLAVQKKIIFEIIVVDGGSADLTLDHCSEFLDQKTVPTTLFKTRAGRGHQMNVGAKAACARNLLFLHADSAISDDLLLHNALKHLSEQRAARFPSEVAGHFRMRFKRKGSGNEKAYYFYESKTSLNRQECFNGDQGLMLAKTYFESLGRFDESRHYMEDADIGSKLFVSGKLITLPGTIGTSARRFEVEGLQERQILNALMRNFFSSGFHEFFERAEHAYHSQQKTEKLQLKPFLELIHKTVLARGFKSAFILWYKTGGYVANNAWQLAYALDCRSNYRNHMPQGEGSVSRLAVYDKLIGPLLTSKPGSFLTALATLVWFYGLRLKLSLKK